MRKNKAAVTMNLVGNLHGCGSFLLIRKVVYSVLTFRINKH